MSRVLASLGLHRNPYVDRTAEKTKLVDGSFYLHSDLQGFAPSATTYLFFGRRGSGKTTIRLMMQQRHAEYNEACEASGEPQLLIIDLCQPGRIGDCLKSLMHNINADEENWDARFCEEWSSNDLADMILCFAIGDLMRCVIDGMPQGERIVKRLRQRPRLACQFLLLCHLYAHEDSASLERVRSLVQPRVTWRKWASPRSIKGLAAISLLGFGAAGVAGYLGLVPSSPLAVLGLASSPSSSPSSSSSLTTTARSPAAIAAAAAASLGSLLWTWWRGSNNVGPGSRAAKLCAPVRIAETRQESVAKLLDDLMNPEDDAGMVRRLFIGNNAQQKLELLNLLARGCGYQGVAVFGDCFDEVNLLDPLAFPGAVKVFAREVCRNEVLNIGRLHFFFPDSRASLDLSTDRTVREARFDRHFVRDLSWSRFQLEDLAQRRFASAQAKGELPASEGGAGGAPVQFQNLFEHVSREDFSAAISKLHTPRELMVFMTELMARIEAHAASDGAMVAAQDMEIAVNKAKEQSV